MRIALSARPRKSTPGRFNLRQQDAIVGWLLVIPCLIIILGITLQPIIATFILSFFEAPKGVAGPQNWVGFGNYASLINNPIFWQTVGRTLYFMLTSVAFELAIGIAIAQLIHTRPPGWRVLRISLIIPWAVPTIVSGAIWRWIYNADYGALNSLLYQTHLIDKYVPWLIDPLRAMNLVILADIWHTVPFIALIMQSALSTLPAELDEAAAVDGATAWDRFWKIRIPLLRPAILVALIIRSVEAFRVFDIVYIITSGGPAFGTVTVSYQTYLETFSFGNPGRGAALSFLISVFTLAMAFIYIRFLYRPEEKL